METLKKIARITAMPIKGTWKYAQKEIRDIFPSRLEEAVHPRSASQVLFDYFVRLRYAGAPLALVLMTYGAIGYGLFKGSEQAYSEVRQEIKYHQTLCMFEDIGKDMNLPLEYGGMERG